MWLVSSNIANTAFYNSHGFQTIALILLGEDNPDWHAEPIVVSLVSSLSSNIMVLE